MTTRQRIFGGNTKREKLVRKVAFENGITLTSAAQQMGLSLPALLSALRSARPQATTIARIRDWLAAHGVTVSATELI